MLVDLQHSVQSHNAPGQHPAPHEASIGVNITGMCECTDLSDTSNNL